MAKGSIEIIYGPMFSGKTEELIKRMKMAAMEHEHVAVFKPSADVRYGATRHIVSHDGSEMQAIPIRHSRDILLISPEINVIGIDEAQFFDNALPDVAMELTTRGVRVIIAGLDMDYTGQPFGSIPRLLDSTDNITRLYARCVQCGADAIYSYRKNDDKELILIGEKDIYEPRCSECFHK